jgi:hypothetical protein
LREDLDIIVCTAGDQREDDTAVYSVLISGTVYWQHRQMTGGGVVRFTACDRERKTHTHKRTTDMHGDL